MTNELQIFNFTGKNIRIQIINGKEYFCAKDICEILGYSNGKDAVIRHCKKEGVVKSDLLTNGGTQNFTFINEPNLYRLITHSKLPNAEIFEKYVFEKILPEIRKTGSFNAMPALPQINADFILQLGTQMKQLEEEKLQLEITNKQKEIMIQEHIKHEADATCSAVAKHLGLKPNKFVTELKKLGYMNKDNEVYQRYIDAGYFNCKFIKSNENGKSYARYYITPDGFDYFKRKVEKGFFDEIKTK